MRELQVVFDDLVDYEKALEQQINWVASKRNHPESPDILWLLSHPEVITLGARKSSSSNLLGQTSIPVHQITRGGDITYHDPGQITGYLLFSLTENERDLRKFLRNIEESIIQALMETSKIDCPHLQKRIENSLHREEGKTGVFFQERKICSIGISCRHWISFHGFSLNFDSNLKNYALMNPCGMEASLMGNLEDLAPISRCSFLEIYPKICSKIFSRKLLDRAEN